MPIVADDELKVVLYGTMPGAVEMVNVFYCQYTGTADVSDADAVDDMVEWVDSILGTFDSLVLNSLSYDEVKLYRLTVPGWYPVGTGTPTTSPGGTGDMVPHGAAVVLRAPTTRIRSFGRKFFGGLLRAECGSTGWSATVITALGNAVTKWIDPFTSTNGNDYTPGIWGGTGEWAAFQEDGFVAQYPGYQRRRRPGVGS